MAFPSKRSIPSQYRSSADTVHRLPVMEPELPPQALSDQEVYIPSYDPDSESEFGQRVGFVWGAVFGVLGAPLWLALNFGLPAATIDWLILCPLLLGGVVLTSMVCALMGQQAARPTQQERYQPHNDAARRGRVLGAILAVPVAFTISALYLGPALLWTHSLPVAAAIPLYLGLILSPLMLTWLLSNVLQPVGSLLLRLLLASSRSLAVT